MKKFLASMLCIAMILSTMCFTVLADGEPAPRSLNIEASKDWVYAGQEVEISVVVDGEELADAEWNIKYDTDLFEAVYRRKYPSNGFGSWNETSGDFQDKYFNATDNSTLPDGCAVATYRFRAKPQTEDKVCNFEIYGTMAYTFIESIEGTDVVTTNNGSVPVEIRLRPYDSISVLVDDAPQTGDTLSFPYDDDEHSFEVVADPASGVTDITYTVSINGAAAVPMTEAEIKEALKEEGTYEITYTIHPVDGYLGVTEKFTIEITAPRYVVEVNLEHEDTADYIAGKKIVIVYTDTPNAYFTYEGNVMVDVSNSTYKYLDTIEYKYAYAFVTDAISGGDLAAYEANVEHAYGTDVAYKIETYADKNVNFAQNVDIRDVTTAYGVYNNNPLYYGNVNYQKQILKTDVNNDKRVTADDTSAIVNAAYPIN